MTIFERFETYKRNNPCRQCIKKTMCLSNCNEKIKYDEEISNKEKTEATRRLYSVLD